MTEAPPLVQKSLSCRKCVETGMSVCCQGCAAGVSAGDRELSWLPSCVTNLPDSSELLFKWTVTFMYLELSRVGFFSFLSNTKIYSLCPVLYVKSLILYFQFKELICVVECMLCAFSCSCCCMMAACLFLEGEHNSSSHPQPVESFVVKAWARCWGPEQGSRWH